AKFDMRLISVNNIAGEEETLAVFKLRLVGRERFLNGTLTLLTDIDNNYEGALDVYLSKNGEWVQSYIKKRTTACDLYTNFLIKYYFPPNADTNLACGGDNNFKQGQYYFKNIPVSVENWPTWPHRGNLKMDVTFMLKGKVIGGFTAIADVFDKPI
ncbi:hypothetical protein KR032_011426, partial [Drosophila birchii]